jgi:hypothetical protein
LITIRRRRKQREREKYLYKSIQQLCLSRELLLVEFDCKLSKVFLPPVDERFTLEI